MRLSTLLLLAVLLMVAYWGVILVGVIVILSRV